MTVLLALGAWIGAAFALAVLLGALFRGARAGEPEWTYGTGVPLPRTSDEHAARVPR